MNKKLKNPTICAKILGAALFALCLCACVGETEYPEGADSLPTFTTTESVKIIYDTAPTTTTVSETTAPVSSEDETSSVSEETSVCETVTESETAQTSISLSIEDVPDVGISEYYEKTQTQRTISTETEFSPVIVSEETSETVSVTTAASVSERVTDTQSSLTAASSVSVTTVAEELITLPEENVRRDINEQLTDGRISKYTGRKIISHPYSYYTLSEKHKALYDKLVSAMLGHEDKIKFSSDEITFDELFDIYQLIYNDEYRLFYISPTIDYVTDRETGYIASMKFNYTYDKTETEKMKADIEAEADKILSKITSAMNDYDIVKLFHDSIITSCTYKSTDNQNTIYGCLVGKEALCQAYSRTFTYLCSEAGIESFVVLGVANEPHMWNVVKMDGDYYHIDLTWDDPDRADSPDSVRYDYFGLTDKRIRELRQVDDYDYEIPKAEGTKYQYYYYNDLVAASESEAEKLLEREVLAAAAEKRSTVQFMCADDEVYAAVTDKFFGSSSENVIGMLDKIKPNAAHSFNTDSIYHNSNKSTRTVKIFLDYSE